MTIRGPHSGRRGLALCLFAFTASSHAGCTSSAPADDDFTLSSDLAQGLLSRVDFSDGGFVEFRRLTDAAILIAGVATPEGEDRLAGISLSEVLPSDLFTYLTGQAVPEALASAERAAAIPSNPEAFATTEKAQAEEALGVVTQALSTGDFIDDYCRNVAFCGTELSQPLKVESNNRIDRLEGHVNVVTGKLRLRVRRDAPVGDETLATYLLTAAPDSVLHFRERPGDRSLHPRRHRSARRRYFLSSLRGVHRQLTRSIGAIAQGRSGIHC